MGSAAVLLQNKIRYAKTFRSVRNATATIPKYTKFAQLIKSGLPNGIALLFKCN